ncbi:MAG: hypothetical protein RLY31_746 [Bacteroidota bacterium]
MEGKRPASFQSDVLGGDNCGGGRVGGIFQKVKVNKLKHAFPDLRFVAGDGQEADRVELSI